MKCPELITSIKAMAAGVRVSAGEGDGATSSCPRGKRDVEEEAVLIQILSISLSSPTFVLK